MEAFQNAFNHTRVLIVGGAGFVGSNLAKMILASSPSVHVDIVDNLMSAERFNVPTDARVTFIEGTITDDTILHNLKDEYAYIFHLATYHGNQSSIFNPLADHANNTLTTLKLFERIKGFKNLKKVVYSAAGCAVAEKTFDCAAASKECETVNLDMDSPYSISKIIGEFYSKYYFKQHKLPVVRARFQNVFGPGEVLGAGQWRGTPATVWRNVTPTFIYRALKKQALPLENDGIATRDFIFVDDIARGLIHCALYGKEGDVYNLATGEEVSIKELADGINSLTGNTTPIEHLPKRPWDNSGKRYGCPEKAKKEINFFAKTPFLEGLNTTIAWTKENLELIEKTMAKHKDKMGSS